MPTNGTGSRHLGTDDGKRFSAGLLAMLISVGACLATPSCSNSSNADDVEAAEAPTSPAFDTIPPVLDEVPGAAAVAYFSAVLGGEFEAAKGRVTERCLPAWVGETTRKELLRSGLFETAEVGVEPPTFRDFKGFQGEAATGRALLILTRGDVELETIWVFEDGRWKFDGCG